MSTLKSPQIEAVLEYFRAIDSDGFSAQLFTEDFQFFFPKFGIGNGPAEFGELAAGLIPTFRRIVHHRDEFEITEAGNKVIVEGITEGEGADGRTWRGKQTPAGRFCSVFAFNGEGLIERMHIYLDPDYTGTHRAKFLWNRGDRQRW